jgi:branched-chain amino acid transport system ATP-binding protein
VKSEELAVGAALMEPQVGASLTLSDVTKRFGGVAAVSELSLQIAPGELLGVIGPNGAGKSTLLSMVNAAQHPTHGEIVLDGKHQIHRMRTHQAARLGIARAHQIPRPFPRMSVRENLLVASHSTGKHGSAQRGRVDAILEECGLLERSEQPAGSLTLLNLKRLEVARALALNPRLLLLDEVAAGLVTHEIDEITELIRAVHSQGVTIMLVEHVQALVHALAQRVVVLDFGRQIAEGTPAEIAQDADVIRIYLGSGDAGAARRTPPADAQAKEELLRCTELGVQYGKLRALHSVDFEVGTGEVVAVLGANGSGKTTLARTLMGMVAPIAGRIAFEGTDVTGLPTHKRARAGIALCHEGRRLFGGMTVRENLDLATFSRASSEHHDVLLERVYKLFPLLEKRTDSYAGELSGGQQQMVAIARALMSDPKLVIFDELSLGLAPTVIDEIYQAIEQIRGWQIGVILIEQNAYRALAIADRAYVLERGNVTYVGSPEPLEDPETLRAAYFGGVAASRQAQHQNEEEKG